MISSKPALRPAQPITIRSNVAIRIGAGVLLVILAAAVLAGVVPTHDPLRMNPANRLEPPFAHEHILGTDHLGRDVLARLLYGARLSFSVALVTVALVTVAGVLIGCLSAFFASWDLVIMRLMDAFMSLPAILLAIALMAVLGRSLVNVVLALTVVYTPRMARVVRGAVLSIKNLDYVHAAEALGAPMLRIMWRHVLPNCMGTVLVQATFLFANAVLAEASLSFLGVGLDPGEPSWGTMLNEGRMHMREAPWTTLLPGAAIMLTVLALNLLGDGLRDALDPTLKYIR